MLTKVTLTKVYRSDTDKNGNKLVSKNGKPYTKVGIKTAQHGEQWLNGFGNFDNRGWNEGDQVLINIEQNGQYLNFSTPGQSELLQLCLEKIEGIERALNIQNGSAPATPPAQTTNQNPQTGEPEINVEDIPF